MRPLRFRAVLFLPFSSKEKGKGKNGVARIMRPLRGRMAPSIWRVTNIRSLRDRFAPRIQMVTGKYSSPRDCCALSGPVLLGIISSGSISAKVQSRIRRIRIFVETVMQTTADPEGVASAFWGTTPVRVRRPEGLVPRSRVTRVRHRNVCGARRTPTPLRLQRGNARHITFVGALFPDLPCSTIQRNQEYSCTSKPSA